MIVTAGTDIEIVAPSGAGLSSILGQRAWRAFDERVVAFVSEFSRRLLTDREIRRYPELVSLGYWMRKANIERLRQQQIRKNSVLRGRGLALHIAPGNVDTIFIYSLIISLLAGNANIVRISSRRSDQVDKIVSIANALLGEGAAADMRERLLIVRFGRDDRTIARLSELIDLRIVWGGDETVRKIGSYPMQPRAKQVAFPDRWSIAVLDAKAFLQSERQEQIVQDFSNDAYWFSQMACSSPRAVIWRGQEAEAARARDAFWAGLEHLRESLIRWMQPVDYINKRVFEDDVAAHARDVVIRPGEYNIVSVINAPMSVARASIEEHCGAGTFLESRIEDIDSLGELCGQKLQTIASFGIEMREWADLLERTCMSGVDRIVPIGRALEFNSTWDGMDLFREFGRETTIEI